VFEAGETAVHVREVEADIVGLCRRSTAIVVQD
jgi:hypothetical protein